jgi:PAS domain S-box-containing protein
MYDKRIDEIFKAIQEVASGNFTRQIKISDAMDEIDGIATGINMLAEEVQLRIEKYSDEQKTLTRTIDQLKELRLELSNSEKLFWQVFQTSPDGISISRLADGIFVEVNKSFEDLTGYTRKELIGHSVFEFELWANPADRNKMTRKLKLKGFYDNLEADFKIRNGKIIRGLISSSMMDISGEPHIVTISRNITGIREAERDLNVSREKYQELIQLAPDGIILVDTKGRIEMANSAFLRMTGLRASEARGLYFKDFQGFDDENRSIYKKAFERILKGGAAKPFEMSFRNRSGETRYIEILAKALKQEGRISGIQAVVRDITERIRAMEIMKASEIRYRTSMDSIQDSIYLVDQDLNILLANEALKTILKSMGLPTNIVGKHCMEALPFLCDSTIEGYREIFRKGNTIHKEGGFKIAGHQFFTETRLIPIVENKKITRVLTILQDITERKKAEHVQQIMYNISNAVNLTRNLNDLFITIQNELGQIFDTRNFFIAFYNKEDDTLSLPFFVDEKDAFDSFPAEQTLTGYMIHHRAKYGWGYRLNSRMRSSGDWWYRTTKTNMLTVKKILRSCNLYRLKSACPLKPGGPTMRCRLKKPILNNFLKVPLRRWSSLTTMEDCSG